MGYDVRESSAIPKSWTADHARQTLTNGEGVTYPASYQVCPVCDGRGSFVNPAIDSNGLSDDMTDDPDFMADYRSGQYDVMCPECQGRNVVLAPTSAEGQSDLQEELQEAANYAAEVEAERRMGA